MITALVFGHHPFPSPTATTQLDGIRSDLTTNFLANLSGFSSFCFWFFWQFPAARLPTSRHESGELWAQDPKLLLLCSSLALVDAMQAAYHACRCWL
jgi:hypothetical protein